MHTFFFNTSVDNFEIAHKIYLFPIAFLRFWPQLMLQKAPGPYLKNIMLQEHIANMLLEQCAFQIWSWSIFDLENSFILLMVLDHKSTGP